MEIVFVRHGATQWNEEARFQGQSDIGLSEAGKTQARELAAHFAAEEFDRIISSDLARAYETARIIAPDRRIDRDARWREFNFGIWEGELVTPARMSTRLYTPENAEPYEAVRARVAEAIAAIRAQGGERIMIVTHAGPIHAALEELTGDPGVRLSLASITRVRLSETAADLLAVNEVVANRPQWE